LKWTFRVILSTGILASIFVAFGFAEPSKEKHNTNLGQVGFIGGVLLGIVIVILLQGFKMKMRYSSSKPCHA